MLQLFFWLHFVVPLMLFPTTNVLYFYTSISRGQGNVVGTATGYGLDGPGIESRWR